MGLNLRFSRRYGLIEDGDNMRLFEEEKVHCPCCNKLFREEELVEREGWDENICAECAAAPDEEDLEAKHHSSDESSGCAESEAAREVVASQTQGPEYDQPRPPFSHMVVFADGATAPFFTSMMAAERHAEFMRSMGCECYAREI